MTDDLRDVDQRTVTERSKAGEGREPRLGVATRSAIRPTLGGGEEQPVDVNQVARQQVRQATPLPAGTNTALMMAWAG